MGRKNPKKSSPRNLGRSWLKDARKEVKKQQKR
jgi:hypothetical protein